MGSLSRTELERHAAKFGPDFVMETAVMSGLSETELGRLQLRLFEIEQSRPKRRVRRGRR